MSGITSVAPRLLATSTASAIWTRSISSVTKEDIGKWNMKASMENKNENNLKLYNTSLAKGAHDKYL
jgi:hypothetical protein